MRSEVEKAQFKAGSSTKTPRGCPGEGLEYEIISRFLRLWGLVVQQFVRITWFVLVLSLVLSVAALLVPAQTPAPKALDAPAKFDEYGSIGGCDHSARLDNLAIQLQNDPRLKGQVIYYGPERSGEHTQLIIRDYLVNNRGIEADRLESVYGGPNDDLKEPRVELWLAPLGALPPALTTYKNDGDTFTGLFDDSPSWDSIAQGEGTGPPVPGVTLASFAEIITNRKNTAPYIVAFNGADAAPGAWRRVAQLELERLQRLGIETSRIKVIYGGADKETKIQLWILPADAPPPVSGVPPEPLPEKTIQIGSFSDYDVAEEREERWAFNGFVDVLRSNENLRACIIVRLETDLPAESETESAAEPTSEAVPIEPPPLEFPRAEFLKLVEKWRAELADKYKIQQDRFIVLFVTGPKDSGNSLETWIVPSGAPLPDPYAEPAEETSDETEPVEGEPDKGGVQPDEGKSDKVRSDVNQQDKPQPEKKDPPQLLLPDA